MIFLNHTIWQETVEAALEAVGADTAWGRAIKRGARELVRSPYGHFSDGVLKLRSTTSKKDYVISDEHHTCEATQADPRRRICKHRAALQLMKRYTARLEAAAFECKTCAHIDWSTAEGHTQVTTHTTTITPCQGQPTTRRTEVRQSLGVTNHD